MNIVKKIISLENSKSRLPGVIPSIIDDKFTEYNDKTSYSGNYGLIVSDIEIPSNYTSLITDKTDIGINILTSVTDKDILSEEFYLIEGYSKKNYDYYKKKGVNYYYIKNNNIYLNDDNNIKKYLSYYTLITWYRFFNAYNKLIHYIDCGGKKDYSTAYTYYIGEIENKSDELEAYYKNLDSIFKARGSNIFYEWICKNCIVKYDLPIIYRDGWNRDSLYYPEILQWKSWFEIRYKKYKNITECKTTTDCCECEEYMKRGGNTFYEWINNITITPIKKEFVTNSSSININVNITSSIDDMGEFSIFSKEWEEGKNYHTDYTEYRTPSTPSNGGSLSIHNNEVIMLKSDNSYSGFTYDEKYKEILFADNQWTDYYGYYADKNKSEFDMTYSTYTHDRNNKFIGNPTPKDLSENYPIVYENMFIINDNVYKPSANDYIKYNSNYYIVQYYANGTPYTIVNGKIYVAIYYNGNYRFNFKYKPCVTKDDYIDINVNGKFILYNGAYYIVYNNKVTINNILYSILNGYTTIDGIMHYISGDTLVTIYSIDNNTMTYVNDVTFGNKINGTPTKDNTGYIINIFDKTITLYYSYITYNTNEISGITNSKLNELVSFKSAYDDMGKRLPGFFAVNQVSGGTTYSQPKEGDTLDLYYTVGNTNNLSKKLDENNLPIKDEFFGDIISEIIFFYYMMDGKTIALDSTFNVKDYNFNNLTTIKKCEEQYKKLLEDNVMLNNSMRCKITYYIGANIKQNVTKNGDKYTYKGYTYKDGGVKYEDIMVIEKKESSYYLDSTNNYVINYYNLIYDLNNVVLNEYGNKISTTNKSNFSMKIPSNNGFIASPIIREEYKFGMASPQKVVSDVYVDRGINAALDKHLKLGEVSGFESLSNYGNSWFNIINNNS